MPNTYSARKINVGVYIKVLYMWSKKLAKIHRSTGSDGLEKKKYAGKASEAGSMQIHQNVAICDLSTPALATQPLSGISGRMSSLFSLSQMCHSILFSTQPPEWDFQKVSQSVIYDSQQVETTQMPINWRMDKQNRVYSYGGMKDGHPLWDGWTLKTWWSVKEACRKRPPIVSIHL